MSRTDNFTRANNTSSLGTPSDAGSAWTAANGTWGILSNQGYCSATGSGNPAAGQDHAVLSNGSANATTQVTLATFSDNAGIVARWQDANNFLLFDAVVGTSQTWVLYKCVAGSFTSLGTATATSANGDTIAVKCDGSNNITCYHNGTAIIGPISVSNFSTQTSFGIYDFNGTNNRYASFSITDLAGAAVQQQLATMGCGN